jgi:hypothetical protein
MLTQKLGETVPIYSMPHKSFDAVRLHHRPDFAAISFRFGSSLLSLLFHSFTGRASQHGSVVGGPVYMAPLPLTHYKSPQIQYSLSDATASYERPVCNEDKISSC